MPIHLPGNRCVSAGVLLLRLIAVLGFAAAIAAMTIPGPATDITGIATILALGALALLAGHTWGAVVVSAADLVLVGKLWPTLFLTGGHHEIAAFVTLGLAIPGLVLFALTLPNTVETVMGKSHRGAQLALALGSAVYLILPMLGRL